MSNQKKIREVIDLYQDDVCLYTNKVCEARGQSNYCRFGDDAYKCLMERLTELGVVIKVNREMPDSGYDCDGYYLEV